GSWRLSSWSPSDLVRESLSQFDLDVDAGRKVESHQRVDGLRGRAVDVDQALVRAHLEVLARVLVLERAADHAVDVLLGGQGHRADDGRAGALSRLHDLGRGAIHLLVVVAPKTDADLLLRHRPPYLMTSVTTPAPTVRPPSRIAKRRPWSMAIGWISSISMWTVSPATDSTPPSLGRAASRPSPAPARRPPATRPPAAAPRSSA